MPHDDDVQRHLTTSLLSYFTHKIDDDTDTVIENSTNCEHSTNEIGTFTIEYLVIQKYLQTSQPTLNAFFMKADNYSGNENAGPIPSTGCGKLTSFFIWVYSYKKGC
jgi:hypothetical protein